MPWGKAKKALLLTTSNYGAIIVSLQFWYYCVTVRAAAFSSLLKEEDGTALVAVQSGTALRLAVSLAQFLATLTADALFPGQKVAAAALRVCFKKHNQRSWLRWALKKGVAGQNRCVCTCCCKGREWCHGALGHLHSLTPTRNASVCV